MLVKEIVPGRRAVFLDRDGVINEDRDDYVKSLSEFEFLPGTRAALRELSGAPFLIVIVTNQPALHRGLMTYSALAEIHDHLLSTVKADGGRIDAVYYCPHTSGENCGCRKPRPGLFLQAAQDLGIDPNNNYCVGDKLSDLEAGQSVGCQGIWVQPAGIEGQAGGSEHGYRVVADLREAVGWILSQESAR